MPIDERHRIELAAAAALAARDVSSVRLAEEAIDAGSTRSLVTRAVAHHRDGRELPVVIKRPIGAPGALRRERAALTLARDHGLPHVVRLLGAAEDPALLILEDLGHGLSVADRLLGDDPLGAERAVLDWAGAIGELQGASASLGVGFRAALAREVTPSPAALAELRALADPGAELFSAETPVGLVPGDSCPDNAIEADGRLTLIDFESAACRPAAWEGAYLTVPWPTCWCCWAMPPPVAQRALAVWQEALSSTGPPSLAPPSDAELATATIGWVWLMVGFSLSRMLADPEIPRLPLPGTVKPDGEPLVQHRLELVTRAETERLPALRELAQQTLEACRDRWGTRELALAPAFREA